MTNSVEEPSKNDNKTVFKALLSAHTQPIVTSPFLRKLQKKLN